MVKREKNNYKGGYLKVFSVVNKIFNFLIALFLTLLSSPLFLMIAILIKVQDGGPVFYAGTRLGLKKKSFTMYKFRTLIQGADKIIGAEILDKTRHRVMIPLGRFLRETRLDELPQLLNILKGDMDFVGPRPVRPEIYEKFGRHIRGYDKRFVVKPGLIGYSQLFTPHSSPKRIRVLIDNKLVEKKQKFIWDFAVVFFTMLVVAKKILHTGIKFLWNDIVKVKILHRYREKRSVQRVKLKNAAVYIGPALKSSVLNSDGSFVSLPSKEDTMFDVRAELVDINEEAVLIRTDSELRERRFLFKMETWLASIHRKRDIKKTVLCRGEVYKRHEVKENGENSYRYFVKYRPVSRLNHYMNHQYFLYESMV